MGKTSFINHLLGSPRGYPGSHVGPEPTTDRFIAIMHGDQDRVLPGNLVSTSADKPFAGLAKFGNAFLSKFCCAEVKSEILNKVTLVDTPGVLAGEKQRVGRDYDMNEVTRWFAERSDIILLMFDAHKLDISDEFKEIIWHLRGHEEKIRIVLNKSDQVTPKQLLRVHGALMWSLGKFFQTPEVCRVYVSSFWGAPYASVSGSASVALFDSEKADLYADIGDIERYAAVRRWSSATPPRPLTTLPSAAALVASCEPGCLTPSTVCAGSTRSSSVRGSPGRTLSFVQRCGR